MARVVRRSKRSYFFDFLVIIAGITVSFLLNEWREGKRIEAKKEHLLVDINNDLYTDSLVLEHIISIYETMARSHDSLLDGRKKQFNDDSLTTYLDHLTSYYPFSETANTYKRINTDSDLTIERDDSLIWYYMNLHNLVYANIEAWQKVEQDFILETALPYMDKNAPFIYPSPPNKSFDGKVFYELRKKDEFMNYVKSGKVYKNAILQVLNGVLDYVVQLKKKVVKQVVERRKSED